MNFGLPTAVEVSEPALLRIPLLIYLLGFYRIVCVMLILVLSLDFSGMDDEDDPTSLLHEVLDDRKRVGYFKGYLNAVAQSIRCVPEFC